jgi:hypothetical protein
MIDEPCQVSISSSVNNRVVIHTEQITAADANRFVAFLTQISNRLSNHLTYVFNNHLTLGNLLQGKQTPIVYSTAGKLQLLLTELQKLKNKNNRSYKSTKIS